MVQWLMPVTFSEEERVPTLQNEGSDISVERLVSGQPRRHILQIGKTKNGRDNQNNCCHGRKQMMLFSPRR
jgi:hypothetical protein